MSAIQAVRGMKDVLPEEMAKWHHVESVIRQTVAAYGYEEMRMPILEKTQLFKRSIGEVTDIVEKEMYTFDDRNGDSLSLRPEGTAQCVRAGIEHGLLHNQIQRLWYYGPMYRHERPQRGRYRQFYQLGIESFGVATPDMDVEQICLAKRLWQRLGIDKKITLEINSIGDLASRDKYKEALVAFLSKHEDKLDDDAKRRLHTNPMRILDSKNPDVQQIVKDAPKLNEYIDAESKADYEAVKSKLSTVGIEFEENPRLVRGLDYYNKLVYEWVTDELGAQGTVCAGGRYDSLVEWIGGKATPASGFALGVERIIELMEANITQQADIYLIQVGEKAEAAGLSLAEKIRDIHPDISIVQHTGGGSFKSQFKKADKSGAKLAFVLGEDEISNEVITVKHLRDDKPQESIAIKELGQQLPPLLQKGA